MDSLYNFRLAYYYGGSLGRAIKSSISLQELKVLLLKPDSVEITFSAERSLAALAS